MNNDAECHCCPPVTCDACMPQCSTKPYVMIRAERPLRHELVCSTRNCNIFGGHDTNPPPECRYQRKVIRTKDENENSLGTPIGLVASSTDFKNEDKAEDITKIRYATNLEALARLYLNDEKTWDSLVLDDIMKEGLNLYTSSQSAETDVESSPADIYMPSERDILRYFQLSEFNFHLELMPQFTLDVTNSTEVGAKGDGVELTLADFIEALKKFFRQHKYGLVKVQSFYALLWRSKDAYFVFDACGRRVTDFRTDKDKGVAMLICLRSLKNVKHLIVNLSGLQETDPLIIREMKVVKVITPEGGIMQKDYGIRTHQYEIVNDDYAYLKSEFHLSLNRRDLLRNRSGLPVAVAAIIVSKIDHPATWDLKVMDKIICFGVNFCQSSWSQCKSMETIDIREFPTYFTLGQFHVNIELEGCKYEGTWRCVPGFRHSELADNIRKAFEAGDCKLILKINYQMYAIWKKHEFIYLLDPYRHRILGKQNESEAYEQMEKSATLRMFRSFEVFMNVLNHMLLDSNRTSRFCIHALKVKNIHSQQKGKPGNAMPVEEPKLDAYGEVMSINEHVCFEEAEDMCKAVLGEISDYEDEDLKSDVDEIELRTSSSEEELLGEEEAGAETGEVEEFEGLESSSSGEEGEARKRNTGSAKGRGKSSKGKANKGKGGRKEGGSKKTKKGKGANDSEADRTADGASDGKTKRAKETKTTSDGEINKPMSGKQNKSEKRRKNKSTDEGDLRETKKIRKNLEESDKDNEANRKKGSSRVKDAKDSNKLQNREDRKRDNDLSRKVDFSDDNDRKEGTLKGKKRSRSKEKSPRKDRDTSGEQDPGKDKFRKDKFSSNEDENIRRDKFRKDKFPSSEDENIRRNKFPSSEDENIRRDKFRKDKFPSSEDTNIRRQKSPSSEDTNIRRDKFRKDKFPTSEDTNIRRQKSPSSEDTNVRKNKISKDKFPSSEDTNIRRQKSPSSEDTNVRRHKSPSKHRDVTKDTDLFQNEYLNIDQDRYIRKDLSEEFDFSKKESHMQDKDIEQSIQPALEANQVELHDNQEKKLVSDKEDEMVNDANKITKESSQDKEKSTTEDELKEPADKTGEESHHSKDVSQLDIDGTEADDENEEYEKYKKHYCSRPNPNRYPGYNKYPVNMAVVGSESGSYKSICKLFQAGFKVADRILIMTPWDNFVIFRCADSEVKYYYLFDGCTCNFNRFRYFDLSVGTAGLICFEHIHNVIEYIRHLRKSRRNCRKNLQCTADEICEEYCNISFNLRL